MYLNSPHAEAPACLPVLPPPGLSVSAETRNRISRLRVFIRSLMKSWERPGTLTVILSSLSRSMSTAFWRQKCKEYISQKDKDDDYDAGRLLLMTFFMFVPKNSSDILSWSVSHDCINLPCIHTLLHQIVRDWQKGNVTWWNFSPVDKNTARCFICEKKVPNSSNTRNLFKHVKTTNPEG